MLWADRLYLIRRVGPNIACPGSEDTMTEQNVKVVRAVYDSFAAGDVDAVFAAMTPEIEWDESEGMPTAGSTTVARPS